jgi:hypothetical protein
LGAALDYSFLKLHFNFPHPGSSRVIPIKPDAAMPRFGRTGKQAGPAN